MGDSSRAPVPFRLAPRVWAGFALGLAGGILLFVGWWGVSGESLVALQLPYVASATIPGAALVVAGAVLLSGRSAPSAVDPRVDALVALLTETAGPTEAAREPEPAQGEPPSTGGFVTIDGGRHYHRPTCAMVAGKATHRFTESTPGMESTAGIGPCPVCTP